MHKIGCFIIVLGLFIFKPGLATEAQEALRPAVQVIIDADGSVKVIDPKTGRDIPSVVVRVHQPARVIQVQQQQRAEPQQRLEYLLKDVRTKAIELERAADGKPRVASLQPGQPKPQPPAGNVEKAIERLIKDLEEMKRDLRTPKDAPAQRMLEVKPHFGAWQVFPAQPGGPPRIVGQPATGSIEGKLDLILKVMDEMRRDIKNLQDRLPGPKDKKGPNPGPRFEFEFELQPAPGQPGQDKKPSPLLPRVKPADNKGQDEVLQKALEALRKQLEAKGARPMNTPDKKQPDRSADVDRRIQQIIQEVEELRQEIRKKQSPK